MKAITKRLFIMIFLGAALLPRVLPASEGHPGCPGKEVVPAQVLMLVPAEFQEYTYVSLYRGQEILHRLGARAVDELWAQIRPTFESLTVRPVESEAAAREMLNSRFSNDLDLQRFDLIAIPKFTNVSSWAEGQYYGFKIDIQFEVYPYDMSKVTTVKGHGESKTGVHASSSPGESANLALKTAVEAINDGLCGRAALLMP